MNPLSPLDLSLFDLEAGHFSELDSRTIVIKKWNWDYQKAHDFQRACVEYLHEHPSKRILICCNHPRVFTNGRGLQKPKKGEVLELRDFKPEDYPSLPYPIHQTRRGGGITFHHPGQFIFYPIVKLNPKGLSLSNMIDDIFQFSIDVLTTWGIEGVNHQNQLLGLWYGSRKIASMGIAIEKLTTYHGMALNIYTDEEMQNALRSLNPCGLSPDIYSSVEEICERMPENAIEAFAGKFLERVRNNWH